MKYILLFSVLFLTGCNGGIDVSLRNTMYYPDQIGNTKFGDPRKPAFANNPMQVEMKAIENADMKVKPQKTFNGFSKLGGE